MSKRLLKLCFAVSAIARNVFGSYASEVETISDAVTHTHTHVYVLAHAYALTSADCLWLANIDCTLKAPQRSVPNKSRHLATGGRGTKAQQSTW